MQTQEATARRAARMIETYRAAVGRPAAYAAPETAVLPEWVRRAQESRLPVRVSAR